jgi:IS4 transposase
MLSMIPQRQFEKEAEENGYNRYTKHFTVWNQFKVNLYAQISGKKSLRDIETGLKVQHNDWYHLGLKNVSRSQLANVNKSRSYEIFQHLYYELYARCTDMTPQHKFRFKNPLHIMDSSVITLCSSLFPWAEYTQQKGALKLHTLLDYKGTIPSFVAIKPGKSSDITVAKKSDLPLSKDSIIVGDKAYNDFKWFTELNSKGVFFVIRAKDNLKYEVIRQQTKIQKKKIISDEEILVTGVQTSKTYPNPLRLIKIWIEEENFTLLLITNNFKFAASTIAQIYKARWDIEKFFRWIKQNLKIKTFLGTSQNAVLIQIWTALTYYLLLAYIKFQTQYKFSLLHFARVLREALFKKVDIIDTLNINPNKLKKARDPCVQKKLFDLQKFS